MIPIKGSGAAGVRGWRRVAAAAAAGDWGQGQGWLVH